MSSKHEQYVWSLQKRTVFPSYAVKESMTLCHRKPSLVTIYTELQNIKHAQYRVVLCPFFSLQTDALYLQYCIKQYMAELCVCNNKAPCFKYVMVVCIAFSEITPLFETCNGKKKIQHIISEILWRKALSQQTDLDFLIQVFLEQRAGNEQLFSTHQ